MHSVEAEYTRIEDSASPKKGPGEYQQNGKTNGHVVQVPHRVAGFELFFVMIMLIVFGSINFVLIKVLYNAYGEEYSFFVSQGINLLYVVYGGLLVYPRLIQYNGVGDRISSMLGMGNISLQMRKSPQRRFLIMGMLDSCGTFFTAMGAVYTPGQYQTLLNQSLIPWTMIMSVIFLRLRYSCKQTMGAFLIVSGAVISLLPRLVHGSAADTGANEMRSYAVAIYWLSNLPMACSAVYKESRFTAENLDVCYLTQWVSIYQLLFGFVLAPLQVIPGVGTAHGISFQEIWDAFIGGFGCFAQLEHTGCAERHTFLLLWAYVGVNFCFNTTGLWLTKHGGAVLNSISFALLLPLTTVFFSFPCLGRYREHLYSATFVGLGVVLCGFVLWRVAHVASESIDEDYIPSRQCSDDSKWHTPPTTKVARPNAPSFQERVVGMGEVCRCTKCDQDPASCDPDAICKTLMQEWHRQLSGAS